MISREKKEKIVTRMRERFAASQALVIAENAGLTVAQMESLRRSARACGGSAQVVKNTLARRACEGTPFAAAVKDFSGPLIYGVGSDSPALAKVFADAAKDHEKLILRGGALPDGDALDAAGVRALAALPSREQLLAMVANAFAAPIASFARALLEVPAGLARALAEAARQKQSQPQTVSAEEKSGEKQ